MLKRTLLASGLLLLLGFLMAFGWMLFGDAIQERLRRQRFNRAAWQGQTDFTDDVRIRMVDDLLRHHSFQGMTREELVGIVGEPDETVYFKEWDMVYWLGPERGFISIDSEWLVFKLDDKKRVVEYRLVTD